MTKEKTDDQRFPWIKFYEAMADGLIKYRNERDKRDGYEQLFSRVKKLADELGHTYIKNEKLDDIDPFTVMGLFNRDITDVKRKAVAKDLADFLDVDVSVPETFKGIPIMDNQHPWFFGSAEKYDPKNIELLWDFLENALHFSDSDDSDARSKFIASYDKVTKQYGIGWNITKALYWIRPRNFLPLDDKSRVYIAEKLIVYIGNNGPKRRCNALDYLKLRDRLKLYFQKESYPVHSFPELSLAAGNRPK